jgi:pyruvate/2-oxoglutarate dehydrogenase complex dihydrolipoamide dehydrogenase (E3) component
MDLCTVTEVLAGKITGDRVIVLGGGQAGLVTADFLAEKGREVAVLNRKRHFAEEMASNDRFYLRERLKRESVHLFKQVSVKAFTDRRGGFYQRRQSGDAGRLRHRGRGRSHDAGARQQAHAGTSENRCARHR